MSDASFDSLKDYNTLMDVFPAAMETPDPVSMLSQALKAVATVSRATSAHLVTDVYSWGYGVEGSLGHNDTANCDIPKPIATFRRMSIQQFSAGRHLSLFVSEHGDVYQCGQFSDCTTASQWIPRRIHALPPIQTTAAGTKACYAISGPSADSTPSCHHARSARDDCVRFCWPGKVDFANFRPIGYGCAHRSMPFPLAACMIVATENAQGGVLFAWGNGTFGQLGLGSEAKHQVPHIVHALMHVRVTIVRAGFHFAAAITSQGHLYTWGYGRHGQLGHNSTANELSPRRVEGLACVVDVALGSTHALAISGSRVFSWGHNTAGCLGIGGPVDRDVLVPTEVLFFRHMQTCHVSAGSDHSLFLCVVGIKTYVYSCGSNRFGQLGINATISHSDNPQCVQEFEYRSQSRRVAQVFAGDRYSVALLGASISAPGSSRLAWRSDWASVCVGRWLVLQDSSRRQPHADVCSMAGRSHLESFCIENRCRVCALDGAVSSRRQQHHESIPSIPHQTPRAVPDRIRGVRVGRSAYSTRHRGGCDGRPM
ncbi:hypothetical protein, variant 1 [Aphanomyces invadans]|uniref:Uncharacterized protein n=1 Tax=Aphanomyces invadans TaxID=157072 RepID=A0A024U9W3_9STRA|nr:hypothetical protein, variant 1 [Aphanomyces invadans]ETW02383.1 hypothetical protein, variant 1 [Aphanomyces invadans]|eukprot:XP_008868988.1 hypothetical protein, variant 1 [Aphanomyces invadans]